MVDRVLKIDLLIHRLSLGGGMVVFNYVINSSLIVDCVTVHEANNRHINS